MHVLTDISQLLVLLTLAYAAWLLISRRFRRPTSPWPAGPVSSSWLWGNTPQIFDTVRGFDFIEEIVNRHGGIIGLKGFFSRNELYVSDALALQHILVKDEGNFEETADHIQTVFGPGIFSSIGAQHQRQRKLFNSAFSSAKLRSLIDVFEEIVFELREEISNRIIQGEREIDMLALLSTTALELIGQGGLGHSFGGFSKKKDEYSAAVKEFLPAQFRLGILRPFSPWLLSFGSPKLRRFLVEICPVPDVQLLKRIVDIMGNTSRAVLTARKMAIGKGTSDLLDEVGARRDILTALLHANMTAVPNDYMLEEEILAHMNSLIFAAHDTTSGAIARILEVLAIHPDAQEKLRFELQETLQSKPRLDYDTLMSLPFLDAVCRETLRLYPPVTFVVRTACKDTLLPLDLPFIGTDGHRYSEVFVPRGTNVYIGIAAANSSPHIWGPDAREWNPDRWLSSMSQSTVHNRLPGVYSSMLTFLGGSRSCIGFKFSQLEMKTVLAVLLRSFVFKQSSTATIVWRMAVTRSPHVGEKGYAQSMPMAVYFVKPEE